MPNHLLEGVEDEFMGSQGELAMTASFLIKCSRHTLLKFTSWIGNVSTVVANIVEVNHQLEIFRHVAFRPVLRSQTSVQVAETNLVDREERQTNVLQPTLGIAQVTHTATLLDCLTAQEDGVADKRRMTAKDGGEKEVSLVQSISIGFNQVEVVGFTALVFKRLGSMLRKSKSGIVEELGNSLENDRRLHSSIGIIDANQVTNANIVSKHDVASSVIAVRDLQQALIKALSSRFGKIFRTKVQTQMSVQVGGFLELSTTVNSGTGNPSDLEVVVEEHAVKDFIDILASQPLQVTTGNTRNALQDLTQSDHLALGFHCSSS